LPDAALLVTASSVAALHYRDFVISAQSVRYIEEETVPKDAKVVGDTWRFVNKSGGPDRRFSFNKQLPICLYGEMDFQSASGLNAKIYFSQLSAGDRFLRVFEALHQTMPSHSDSKPIAFYKEPSRRPAIFFGSLFLSLGAALASSGLPYVMNSLTAVQRPNWAASDELVSARMAQPHFSTGQTGSATTTKVN
jgi:hypothetical protein